MSNVLDLKDKKKVNENAYIRTVIVFVLLLLILCVFLSYTLYKKNESNTSSSSGNATASADALERINKEEYKNATYITETIWNGEDIPAECFDIDFRPPQYSLFGSDYDLTNEEGDDAALGIVLYTSNKELMEEYPADLYDYDNYMEKAESLLRNIFEHNYIDALNNQDDYIKEIVDAYGGDSEYDYIEREELEKEEESISTVSDYAYDSLAWLIANQLDISVEYKTDKCLFFRQLGQLTLRGCLYLTSNDQKNTGSTTPYVWGDKFYLNKGETKMFIVDIIFDEHENFKSFSVYAPRT